MKISHREVITLIVCAILLIGAMTLFEYAKEKAPRPSDISAVQIGKVSFTVNLALTDAEREQGLSGQTDLAPNTGLLFVFDTPGSYGFWMKDMKFPIDMVWVGENMRVVTTKEGATPESYPQIFYPNAPSMYVIELPAGTMRVNNLSVGDSVKFLYGTQNNCLTGFLRAFCL